MEQNEEFNAVKERLNRIAKQIDSSLKIIRNELKMLEETKVENKQSLEHLDLLIEKHTPMPKKLENIRLLAKNYEATESDFQHNIGLIIFFKDGFQINVYLTTMTVVIVGGATYKKCTMMELNLIFRNPANIIR